MALEAMSRRREQFARRQSVHECGQWFGMRAETRLRRSDLISGINDMPLTQITPFILCSQLDRQIAFYRDVLGFELRFQADNYAFMKRDAATIRLIEVEQSVDLSAPERQNSCYIDVDDLDALYQELAPALASLPPQRVRPPFDQPYGQREFHVIDEDCTLIFFGEAIANPSS